MGNGTWPLRRLFHAMFCLKYHGDRSFDTGSSFFQEVAKYMRDLPGPIVPETKLFLRLLAKRFPLHVPHECTIGIGVLGLFVYGEPAVHFHGLIEGNSLDYKAAIYYVTSSEVSVSWMLEIHKKCVKVDMLVVMIAMVLHASIKKEPRRYDVAFQFFNAIKHNYYPEEIVEQLSIRADRMHHYAEALWCCRRDLDGAVIDFESPIILAWNREIVRGRGNPES